METVSMRSTLSRDRLGDAALKPLAITVKTACELSGLGPTKIWELIKQRRLKVARIDRRTPILFASFEALFAPDDLDRAPRRRGRPRKNEGRQHREGVAA
jgi:hypothetical protein